MALDGKYTQFAHGDWEKAGEYNIADGQTFRGSFDGTGGEDVIVYHTSWQNAKDFCQNLMGFAEVDVDQVGGISRELPQRHPYWPSLYCMHISCNGIGIDPETKDNANGNTFSNSYGTCSIPEFAEIVATYRQPPYRIKKDDDIETEAERFVSRDNQFNVDFVSGGTNKLKSVLNPSYMSDTAPPARVPTLTKTLTWHKVPSSQDDPYYPDNWETITDSVGLVNSVEFDGHPAGTVFFESVKPIQEMPNPLDNRWLFDIVMTFKVRDIRPKNAGVRYGGVNYWNGVHGTTGAIVTPRDRNVERDWIGWNSFWMPKSSGFPPIWTYFTFDGTSDGEPYYKSTDFNELFSILPA